MKSKLKKQLMTFTITTAMVTSSVTIPANQVDDKVDDDEIQPVEKQDDPVDSGQSIDEVAPEGDSEIEIEEVLEGDSKTETEVIPEEDSKAEVESPLEEDSKVEVENIEQEDSNLGYENNTTMVEITITAVVKDDNGDLKEIHKDSVTVDEEEEYYTVKAPELEGFTLEGENTKVVDLFNGNTEVVFVYTKLLADETLSEDRELEQITITRYKDGVTKEVRTISKKVGSVFELNIAEVEGYRFVDATYNGNQVDDNEGTFVSVVVEEGSNNLDIFYRSLQLPQKRVGEFDVTEEVVLEEEGILNNGGLFGGQHIDKVVDGKGLISGIIVERDESGNPTKIERALVEDGNLPNQSLFQEVRIMNVSNESNDIEYVARTYDDLIQSFAPEGGNLIRHYAKLDSIDSLSEEQNPNNYTDLTWLIAQEGTSGSSAVQSDIEALGYEVSSQSVAYESNGQQIISMYYQPKKLNYKVSYVNSETGEEIIEAEEFSTYSGLPLFDPEIKVFDGYYSQTAQVDKEDYINSGYVDGETLITVKYTPMATDGTIQYVDTDGNTIAISSIEGKVGDSYKYEPKESTVEDIESYYKFIGNSNYYEVDKIESQELKFVANPDDNVVKVTLKEVDVKSYVDLKFIDETGEVIATELVEGVHKGSYVFKEENSNSFKEEEILGEGTGTYYTSINGTNYIVVPKTQRINEDSYYIDYLNLGTNELEIYVKEATSKVTVIYKDGSQVLETKDVVLEATPWSSYTYETEPSYSFNGIIYGVSINNDFKINSLKIGENELPINLVRGELASLRVDYVDVDNNSLLHSKTIDGYLVGSTYTYEPEETYKVGGTSYNLKGGNLTISPLTDGENVITVIYEKTRLGENGGSGGSSGSSGGSIIKPEDKQNEEPKEVEVDEESRINIPNAIKPIKSYVVGFEDGTVRPSENITRAEAVQMIYGVVKEENLPVVNPDVSFIDVSENEWYGEALEYLSTRGIIFGYGDGTFKPQDTITRAEYFSILVRMSGKPLVDQHSFTDVGDDWARKYIATAAANGYTNGYPDGRFGGSDTTTRAQAIVAINNLLGVIANEDTISSIDIKVEFKDNTPNTWYYYDIVAASNGTLD